MYAYALPQPIGRPRGISIGLLSRVICRGIFCWYRIIARKTLVRRELHNSGGVVPQLSEAYPYPALLLWCVSNCECGCFPQPYGDYCLFRFGVRLKHAVFHSDMLVCRSVYSCTLDNTLSNKLLGRRNVGKWWGSAPIADHNGVGSVYFDTYGKQQYS